MSIVGNTTITRSFSLLEVLQSLQTVIRHNFSNRIFWVRCELARISLHQQSGHCYAELVDKNDTSVTAQMRGIIWAEHYSAILLKFQQSTQTILANGMKVMLQCTMNFHPVHGLSLNIVDIEPSFTLGEMAKTKNDAIRKLREEKLFERNRSLSLAILPGRLAVISVDTSRGYQDFIKTLSDHKAYYRISYRLFEAILQGENAVPAILKAMRSVLLLKDQFDALVIIRGGAGDVGLACYDEYPLAAAVASFPLPIITGIGHSTNDTVTEMVAFAKCITPTAAANFFIDKFRVQEEYVLGAQRNLLKYSKQIMKLRHELFHRETERFRLISFAWLAHHRQALRNYASAIPAISNHLISRNFQMLKHNFQLLKNECRINFFLPGNNAMKQITKEINLHIIDRMKREYTGVETMMHRLSFSGNTISKQLQTIDHFAEKINLLDPSNILRRGYSITRYNGRAIISPENLNRGEEITTQLADGQLTSIVK
jgi:exodeoxyribonuclease VII large subunit